MDYYNKEEADRAKEAAIKKFSSNDFAGARKFALKAQSLNPDIDGITQMVATFAMHLSAQHIVNGEMDYYCVLGLKPEADDETVKKRYKKLVVMLHPDRNGSAGADEAFKFVYQAWKVLSDKVKRADYDSKRNLGLYGASSSNNGVQKAAKANVNNSAAKVKTSKRGVKRASDASASAPPPPPATTSDGSFWTVCCNCRMQYKYHRVYLKHNLLCPHCHKPFIAVETDPPAKGSIRKTFLEHQFDSIGRKKSRDNNGDSIEWGAVYTVTKNAAQAVRRESTKRAAGTPSTNPPPKRRKVMENAVSGSNLAITSSAPKSNSVREFSNEELRNVLMKKAKSIIIRKLQELSTMAPETDPNVNMGNDAGSSQNKSAIESELTINVPDSDFCDFTKNRTEKSFSDNQIWASYYSLEGMPRVYFVIDKVLSVDPFKVCITQLTTSETNNSELRSSKWLGVGVPRTCGRFRAGESQICKSPYIFSHKVEEVIKGNHGEFLIYPRTGDVWALYKNWSHDWNYLQGGKAVEYDLVEVVEGYTEEYGVSVVPLMKVAGFKSVFQHYLDPSEIRNISKDELSRFSHQIPSYLLRGQEAPDELRSCRQLDPAATPSQLLHVIDG